MLCGRRAVVAVANAFDEDEEMRAKEVALFPSASLLDRRAVKTTKAGAFSIESRPSYLCPVPPRDAS
jgi:hypothetical protein